MDWWRAHHGLPTDPKWITVAKVAGQNVTPRDRDTRDMSHPDRDTRDMSHHDRDMRDMSRADRATCDIPITPGHVVAVWVAILDYASQSTPRGSVAEFQADDIAASFAWPLELVQAIVDALKTRKLIVNNFIARWPDRQRRKEDTTAAERKRRQRAREKTASDGALPADDGHAPSRRDKRDMRDSHATSRVVTTEQSRAEEIQIKATAERSAPASARTFESPEEIWTWVAEAGVPLNIGTRTFHHRLVASWLSQELTEPQIREAMRRAQARRADDNDERPVNVRFLACFVDDVLCGNPIKPTKGGGYERGDELSRDFADAG